MYLIFIEFIVLKDLYLLDWTGIFNFFSCVAVGVFVYYTKAVIMQHSHVLRLSEVEWRLLNNTMLAECSLSWAVVSVSP